VGHKDEYYWDEEKNLLVKEEKGLSLEEICNFVFYAPTTVWRVFENQRYPDQYRVIARVKKLGLVSLVIEDISDDFGTFLKLITWWKSTPEEKRRFLNE